MPMLFAALSSLQMGLFYIFDIIFESRGVYSRSAQAMIVSSVVPLFSAYAFYESPWWVVLPFLVGLAAFISGSILIYLDKQFDCPNIDFVLYNPGHQRLANWLQVL